MASLPWASTMRRNSSASSSVSSSQDTATNSSAAALRRRARGPAPASRGERQALDARAVPDRAGQVAEQGRRIGVAGERRDGGDVAVTNVRGERSPVRERRRRLRHCANPRGHAPVVAELDTAGINHPVGWYIVVLTSRSAYPEVRHGRHQVRPHPLRARAPPVPGVLPWFPRASRRPFHDQWEKDKIVDRGVWLRRASRAFSGWTCPRSTAAAAVDDFRYNAIITEETAGGRHAASASPCRTTSSRRTSCELTTEEQKQRWLPGFCQRRDHHRDRDDRARHRQRPAGHPDHVPSTRRRRLGAQRLEDLHHQRHSRRPRHRGGLHRPRRRAHRASPCWSSSAGMAGFERGRHLDKIGMDAQDTAELSFTDVQVPAEQPPRRGGPAASSI